MVARSGTDFGRRLAATAGLTMALAVVLFLGATVFESLPTVYVSFALALLATGLLAVATCRSAWRALSWRSVLVVGCPLLALPFSLRSSVGASGLHWLAVYLGSTVLLSGLVGITATRQLHEVGRAVVLSIASALLLAAATVLFVLLLWHGDLS